LRETDCGVTLHDGLSKSPSLREVFPLRNPDSFLFVSGSDSSGTKSLSGTLPSQAKQNDLAGVLR
jgi:hypothetical protein